MKFNLTTQVLIGGPRDGQIASIPNNLEVIPVHFRNPGDRPHDGAPKTILSGKYRRSTKGTFVWDGFDGPGSDTKQT